MNKPIFKHDCEACQFISVPHREDEDIYLCQKLTAFPTLIFRYGNEGSEYLSVSLDIIKQQFLGGW